MKVYYHSNCNDGFGAAWAAYTYLGVNAEYIPLGYGEKALTVGDAERLYFLDIVPPGIDWLLSKGIAVTIIDHHKTNEEVANIKHLQLTTKFDVKHSAAVLTFEFFYPNLPIPWILKYVEDYDLWKKELPLTAEIIAAIRSYPFDFAQWSEWARHEGYKDKLVEIGRHVLRTEQSHYRRSMKEVRWISLSGLDIPIINTTVGWNEATNELLQVLKVHVAGYYFDRGDGLRQYGLRGDGSVDVSEIAKDKGGGGHHNAAGFQEVLEC